MHSLKSTSANVGATSLSRLAGTLEQAACDSRLEKIREKYSELCSKLDEAICDIETHELMKKRKTG